MKETLYYNYHITIDNIQEYPEYSCFSWNNKKYYFMKVKRDEKEINSIIKMSIELLNNNIPIFPIIKSINNTYTTKVDNDNYILLEVSNEYKEYDIEEIINRTSLLQANNIKDITRRDNWSSLWIEKTDYMEYQVHELGIKYPEIVKAFTYFKGLAENAICYLNHTERIFNNKDISLTLCHKRIYYPNKRIDYDNPLNFIIDINIRDIAEYLKSEMLNNINLALTDLRYYLNRVKPSSYAVHMLYARLLYPSYYFDEHESILNNNKDNKKLLEIIEKIDIIETFLKESYYIINEYNRIEKLDWLIKKEL